jgi:hypothetical protein
MFHSGRQHDAHNGSPRISLTRDAAAGLRRNLRSVLVIAGALLPVAAGPVWAQRDPSLPQLVRDDASFPASLERIDPGWDVVVRSDGEVQRIAAGHLVAWGAFRDSDRGPQIVLADGSWLIGDLRQIDEDHLRIDSSLWGEISLPKHRVRGVICNPSVDPWQRDRIRRQIRESQSDDHQLWLENGDVIAGTAQRLVEQEIGPGELSISLVFVARGRELLIELDKVTALVFESSPNQHTSQPVSHTLLGLADGTRLNARNIELSDRIVRLVLDGDISLTIDPPSLWELTVLVQPLGAGTVYLSDLESLGYKHLPLLTRTVPLGLDRNSQGGALRSGGKLYAKGLGMPSASRVAYALRGRYQRFAAEIVLDDSAGPSGSVVFRVLFSDGQGRWETAWESDPVRSGDPPRPISVDTRGVQAMVLIVDMGQRGDVQDHANWLNARLVELQK